MAGDIFKFNDNLGGSGSGTPGADGHDAFVTWCLHNGIDPIDPNSWGSYLAAIEGPQGIPGTSGKNGLNGDSVFEEWCKRYGHNPSDPNSWNAFMAQVSGRVPIALVTNKVVPTSYYKDGRMIYKYLAHIPNLALTVGVEKIFSLGLPINTEAWIDQGFSWVLINGLRETANFNRNSFDRAAFWLGTDNELHAISPTNEYLYAEAVICISFLNLNETPINIGSGPVSTLSPGGYVGEVIASFSRTPIVDTLLCNGARCKRIDYPELYELFLRNASIFTINADEFNLPDLRGRFLRGVTSYNSNPGTTSEDSIKTISGSIPGVWMFTKAASGTAGVLSFAGGSAWNFVSETPSTSNLFFASRTINLLTSPAASETMPKNMEINYYIRYMDTATAGSSSGTFTGNVIISEDEVLLPPPSTP